MTKNHLTVSFAKPASKVFEFCVTPPNSTLWIPGVMKETTSNWPVNVGTKYSLTNSQGEISEMSVTAFQLNKLIEWVSSDATYHCRYTFSALTSQSCKLDYYEWVDSGQISTPFTPAILNKLKNVIEVVK